MSFRYKEQSERNYIAEAKDLIKGLKFGQLYELYQIVSNNLKRSNSAERDKELLAVKSVIESVKGIDEFRLASIWNGYKSEMAATAKPKDGAKKADRKRV